MWKRIIIKGFLGTLLGFIPSLAIAGGGDKVEALIVVADTRLLSGIQLYFADLYNENMWLFAVWSVLLTTGLGILLGAIMDIVMRSTGIDLTKRSLIEH